MSTPLSVDDRADVEPQERPLAVGLLVGGLIGFVASAVLLVERIRLAEDSDYVPTCSINPVLSCGNVMESAQAALLGFPNPIIGVACWAAPIAVGVAILAGARFRRWFWMLFNLGVLGAVVLVIFLIYSSLYDVYVLCPYCMITWTVTIPTFWAVTFYNLKEGNIPTNARVRDFFAAAYTWVPLITFISYVIVAVFAQIQVQWIPNAFR